MNTKNDALELITSVARKAGFDMTITGAFIRALDARLLSAKELKEFCDEPPHGDDFFKEWNQRTQSIDEYLELRIKHFQERKRLH